MSNQNKLPILNYVIVIPAYNEERFIGNTIESIAKQTLMPRQVVVVNDGSTDNTKAVVQGFAEKYTWVTLVSDEKKTKHSGGAKVVRAFYRGYGAINVEYDVVVKMDADLIMPSNYFEKVMAMFGANPKLGIAGGIHQVEQDGEWVFEKMADKDHVHGAYKSYRKACFDEIGGPRQSIGWDSLDELIARYKGWEIQTDHSLLIKHNRTTGTETGRVRVKFQVGWSWYRMRYGFFIALTSAVKLGMNMPPKGISGLAALVGWFQAWLRGDAFIVDEDEGRFIRGYRWQRMTAKLGRLKEVQP